MAVGRTVLTVLQRQLLGSIIGVVLTKGTCYVVLSGWCHAFYSVLVSISVFMALSIVFRSFNSPETSPLSHSVLPVSFLPYESFQLYISLRKSLSALI